jgi:hypothetical protein
MWIGEVAKLADGEKGASVITDEELAELPDDPRLAFVEFEKIMRARLYGAEQEQSNYQYGDTEPYRLEYINKVLAAAREFEINELDAWKPPSVDEKIHDIYKQLASVVDHITTQIRIRNVHRKRKYSVGLDNSARSKIHHYIEQIREVIAVADELPIKKRDSLYDKLDTFALEVDRARTPFETATALWVDLCDAIGEGFTKLEPARRWIDSIGTLLGRVKALEDDARPALPKSAERPRLEAPRKKLPAPTTPRDLDDEIPF